MSKNSSAVANNMAESAKNTLHNIREAANPASKQIGPKKAMNADEQESTPPNNEDKDYIEIVGDEVKKVKSITTTTKEKVVQATTTETYVEDKEQSAGAKVLSKMLLLLSKATKGLVGDSTSGLILKNKKEETKEKSIPKDDKGKEEEGVAENDIEDNTQEEEKARIEAENKARIEAEEKAKSEAKEKARVEEERDENKSGEKDQSSKGNSKTEELEGVTRGIMDGHAGGVKLGDEQKGLKSTQDKMETKKSNNKTSSENKPELGKKLNSDREALMEKYVNSETGNSLSR